MAGGYGVRTVPTSDFRYLHLADTAPSPYLGSTRAGVATNDALEGTWSTRVSDAGDLTVHRPSGRTVRLGDRGQWSPYAAPSVVTDAQGRIWVAGVTAAGRVLTARTAPGSVLFSRLRPVLSSARTASPALVVDGQGRMRIFATTAKGTLVERHTPGARSDRWSHPHRMGVPGSWSTHAAPSVVADTAGSTWVAAVTKRGVLVTQHTTRGGRHWSGMHRVDHRTWSGTSTPALAAEQDGRVWLASVGDHGSLFVRHTQARSRALAAAGSAARAVVAVLVTVAGARPQRAHLARVGHRRRSARRQLPAGGRPALEGLARASGRSRLRDGQPRADHLGERRARRRRTARPHALAPPARSGRAAPGRPRPARRRLLDQSLPLTHLVRPDRRRRSSRATPRREPGAPSARVR